MHKLIAKAFTESDEAYWRARSVAALYLGGAIIGTITHLSPTPEEAASMAMFMTAALGYPVALLIFLFGHRIPKNGYHLLGLAGSLIITINIYFSGPTVLSSSSANVYVWIPLWICYYFPLWQGLAHVAAIAVLSSVAFRWVQGDFALALWVNVVGTNLVAALVVGSLARQINYLAKTDLLTGAVNRREWEQKVALELVRAQRYGYELSLVYLDLDRFKQVNDNLGHATGDRVLKALGESARNLLRAEDVFARLGGDEFAMLLPNCPPTEAIHSVRRLSDSLPHGCTLSAGITTQIAGDTPDTIQARSDQALYEAKSAGRNTCRLAVSADPFDRVEE